MGNYTLLWSGLRWFPVMIAVLITLLCSAKFDGFQLASQNLTHQKFWRLQVHMEKQVTICQCISIKYLKKRYASKFCAVQYFLVMWSAILNFLMWFESHDLGLISEILFCHKLCDWICKELVCTSDFITWLVFDL